MTGAVVRPIHISAASAVVLYLAGVVRPGCFVGARGAGRYVDVSEFVAICECIVAQRGRRGRFHDDRGQGRAAAKGIGSNGGDGVRHVIISNGGGDGDGSRTGVTSSDLHLRSAGTFVTEGTLGELDEFIVGVDGHVTVTRHSQGGTIKCSCAGRIASKGVAGRGLSMTQREAYLIAVAIVERIATGNALGVCRDATDGVGAILNRRAYRADGLNGDIVARLNSAGSLALRGAEGAGVVRVGNGDSCGALATKGAAGVIASTCLYLSLAMLSIDDGRGVEAVLDGGRGVTPTYETATIGSTIRSSGKQFAREYAAFDGELIAMVVTYETTVSAVAVDGAVDGCVATAVHDVEFALIVANETASELIGGIDDDVAGTVGNFESAECFSNQTSVINNVRGGIDGTVDVQVLNLGILLRAGPLGIAEYSGMIGIAILRCTKSELDGVALSVEGASKVVLV